MMELVNSSWDNGSSSAAAVDQGLTNLSNAGSSSISQFFPESWLDVLREKNGSVKNPIEVDKFIFSVDCICCLVGLPINMVIAVKILLEERLYNKPRNILLLDNILCNIFTLFTASVEMVYYFWSQKSVCIVYSAIVGLSYVLFFLNLLLSLIDTYVVITNPFWHRRKVTLKLVITWSIILKTSFVLGINWIYIGGFAELQCAFQLTHAMMLTCVLIALFIPCIVLNIIIYIKTREILPNQQLAVGGGASQGSTSVSSMSVHVNSTTLRLMEMEAARVFIAGVTPLLLLPCPLLSFTLFHLICLVIHPSNPPGQCSNTIWLAPYFKQLVTLHAVVHPIVYLCRSEELFNSYSSTLQQQEQHSMNGALAVAIDPVSSSSRRSQHRRTNEELYG